MANVLDAAQPPALSGPSSCPGTPFFAVTSLTFLKPKMRVMVRPLAAKLAVMGVTANQVTLTSLVASIAISAALCAHSDTMLVFALLPLWLPVRTAMAALDGTLAIEFGQKSRLGGILNEVGDIVSDIALFLPLAFVAPFSAETISPLIGLIVCAEVAGIVGPLLGSDRRLEGPLGKADRTIVLAVVGAAIAIFGGLPEIAQMLLPLLYGGLVLTIWNRLRCAIADEGKVAV